MSSGATTAKSGGAEGRPRIDAKALWRKFVAQQRLDWAGTDLHIGLAASFTAYNLVQFVGAPLLLAGRRPKITVGPFNQLFQTCLDHKSHLGAECDVIALLWRIEDLLFEEANDAIASDKAAWLKAIEKVGSLVAAISSLRSNFTGAIIVSVPPLPSGLASGPLALGNPTGLGAFHRAIVDYFVESIGRLEGVRLVDFDAVQRHVGYEASFDPRQWYLYRQPFSDSFLYFAGEQIGRIVLANRRSAKKCVVLDCDNTLWGGIIGEVGLDGIELGAEYPGSAFCDFQRLLLNLRRQGVFLAILSKNNEADVWEVFDRHRAMILKRTDISAWEINWCPKAENLLRIAGTLSIGIDSMVFIDDDPMEIAYMQKALPEVTTLPLPEDPAEIVGALQKLSLFDRLDMTNEDSARVDMTRAEVDRMQLRARMTKQEFMNELQLKLDLSRAEADDIGRVAQLINKTNQFNLTTIRRTVEEIRVLANSPDYRVYVLRVWDKFGDYGLTGVAIINVSTDHTLWTIDTLLLSCRVLGRSVESALLALLAENARAEGVDEFIASFVPTAKNSLAATFLPDHGFRPDGARWRIAAADAPILPFFIQHVGYTGRDQQLVPSLAVANNWPNAQGRDG
jgi:FkbH-like protein